MNHKTGSLKTKDGLTLFTQSWIPARPPRADVVLVHGVGEHSGRYQHVGERFAAAGYALHGYDWRGHGRSEGHRGHVERWDDYRMDLDMVVNSVRDQSDGRPLFLYGHSAGGLMVIDYVLHGARGLAGVIASAPALDAGGAPPALVLIAKLLNKLAPRLGIPSSVDPAELAHDPAVAEAYVADPLVYRKSTPRWGVNALQTIQWVQAHADRWPSELPLLVVHGDADKVVPIGGTRVFMEKVPASDRQLIVYPGGRHETHNDYEQAEAIANLVRWLDEHTA